MYKYILMLIMSLIMSGCITTRYSTPKMNFYRSVLCIDGVEHLLIYENDGYKNYLVPHLKLDGSLYKCYE